MANDLVSPMLSQSVQWGENYVSRALNEKFAGIIHAGIYSGYVLKPAGPMRVLVDHAEGESRSVAVVERDGYSVTVIMNDAGEVKIPAKGQWFVCVEAFYTPNQRGYQRIVVREHLEAYHVPLGKVTVLTDEAVILPLTPESISMTGTDRLQADLVTKMQMDKLFLLLGEVMQRVMDLGARVGLLELQTPLDITQVTVTDNKITEAGSSISPIKVGTKPEDMGDSPIMLVLEK